MGEPVQIADMDGLDLLDTPIFNSAMGMPVTVMDDLLVNGTLTVTSSATVDSLTATTTIAGDSLAVTTSITGATAIIGGVTMGGAGAMTGVVSINGFPIGAGPMCCTSDARMKEDITPIAPQTSLQRMLGLKPLEYSYKKEYQAMDKWAMQHERHRGFLAQDVEPVVPRAVNREKRNVGGVIYDDFRTMNLHQLVPDLVGAIHALHARIAELELKLKQ